MPSCFFGVSNMEQFRGELTASLPSVALGEYNPIPSLSLAMGYFVILSRLLPLLSTLLMLHYF